MKFFARIAVLVQIVYLILFINTFSTASQVKLGKQFPLTASIPFDDLHHPRIAFNKKHNEYLVVYQWSNIFVGGGIKQIHGARIGADGTYHDNFIISDLAYDCLDPDVAYDPVNDRYLVVWSYDINGDGSNLDMQGRLIPNSGPSAVLPSFNFPSYLTYHEAHLRLEYGAVQHGFLLVYNIQSINPADPGVRTILGRRLNDEGGVFSLLEDFEIKSPTDTHSYFGPELAYNKKKDQFLVVYFGGNDLHAGHDVYGQKVDASTGSLQGGQISIAGSSLVEDHVSISFSDIKDTYVVSWDTNRVLGPGEVHVRFLDGDGVPQSVIRVDEPPGGIRSDYYSSVSCKLNGPECLVYWITVHDSSYYTMCRQILVGGTMEAEFHIANLGRIDSWGSEEPQLWLT